MKTKQFLMVAFAMLCAMTATTLFSSCGDDKDDTPQYAMYSHSNHTQDIYISGQTLDYHYAMYLAKKNFNGGEPTVEENLAYYIYSSIELADSYVERTGGVPVNVSERDKQVIEYYDYIFNKIPASSKALMKGKFEIYRSTNGSRMETIKVYDFN